ncbi:MAG: type III-A CRISPR-associated RAMP protein Csm5 [Oscillospiraceae bacterium]|jgi:CRISPR-associated protein Csm5|nr:type III-A CRISPR-associated RAMP protein Csm5 [Oscillospiraceae bacterium]
MRNSVERYAVTLQVLSPVHIGDGREIAARTITAQSAARTQPSQPQKFTEWVLYQDKAIVLNMDRVLDLSEAARNRLMFDMEQHGASADNPCVAYILDAADVADINRYSIKTFMKDPYGQPYVPGSSLKGALRTCLRQALLRTIPPATEDPFHGLSVADSESLHKEDLIVSQKIDRSHSKGDSNMPLVRECLRPDTLVRTTINIDRRLFRWDLEKAVGDFFQDYMAHYVTGNHWEEYFAYYSNFNVLFLGGGTGFESKVIAENTQDRNKQIPWGRHVLKLTFNQGYNVPMGMCDFRMERLS